MQFRDWSCWNGNPEKGRTGYGRRLAPSSKNALQLSAARAPLAAFAPGYRTDLTGTSCRFALLAALSAYMDASARASRSFMVSSGK